MIPTATTDNDNDTNNSNNFVTVTLEIVTDDDDVADDDKEAAAAATRSFEDGDCQKVTLCLYLYDLVVAGAKASLVTKQQFVFSSSRTSMSVTIHMPHEWRRSCGVDQIMVQPALYVTLDNEATDSTLTYSKSTKDPTKRGQPAFKLQPGDVSGIIYLQYKEIIGVQT
jgi:hypothetical protein